MSPFTVSTAPAIAGGFILGLPLADSGTSTVYEAQHALTGKPAAVKLLHAALVPDVEIVSRFVNEALLLQTLLHPRIVTAYVWGWLPSGQPYLAMERLGPSLQVLMRPGAPESTQRAAALCLQIAEALGALHHAAVFHRDLKPGNVLSIPGAPGQVKLADLGLAKFAPPPEQAHAGSPLLPVSTSDDALLGTGAYLAPEQWLRSKSAGASADVYSLGVMLYELLAGCRPFSAEQSRDLMDAHLFEAPPPLLAQTSLGALVDAMLRKCPDERPALSTVAAALAREAARRE